MYFVICYVMLGKIYIVVVDIMFILSGSEYCFVYKREVIGNIVVIDVYWI